MPTNRGGHSAVSTGAEALICGGYTFKNQSLTSFAGNVGIECWWFTPVPHARFDRLLETVASPKPPVRWGHSVAEDPATGHMLVFGGRSASESAPALNDCWILQLGQDVSPLAVYVWESCSPDSATALKPMPRYGAGAVFHLSSNSFYIYGGFAWTGASFVSTSDMWVLRDYAQVSQRDT